MLSVILILFALDFNEASERVKQWDGMLDSHVGMCIQTIPTTTSRDLRHLKEEFCFHILARIQPMVKYPLNQELPRPLLISPPSEAFLHIFATACEW